MINHIARSFSSYTVKEGLRSSLKESLRLNRLKNRGLMFHCPQRIELPLYSNSGVKSLVTIHDPTPSIGIRLYLTLMKEEYHDKIFGVWYADAKEFPEMPLYRLPEQLCVKDLDLFKSSVTERPTIVIVDNVQHINKNIRSSLVSNLESYSFHNEGPFFFVCGKLFHINSDY